MLDWTRIVSVYAQPPVSPGHATAQLPPSSINLSLLTFWFWWSLENTTSVSQIFATNQIPRAQLFD